MEESFIENEWKNLSELCKIGDVIRERDMVIAENQMRRF